MSIYNVLTVCGVRINASPAVHARIMNEHRYHDHRRRELAAKIAALTGENPDPWTMQPSVLSGQEWEVAMRAIMQAAQGGRTSLTVFDDGTVEGVSPNDDLAMWGRFAEHLEQVT